MDMDGSFIPASKVFFGNVEKIQYHKDRIISAYPEKIISRNSKKSIVLQRLCLTDSINKIPYTVYYFSRNLEHALHNKDVDLTDDEKSDYADEFADKYSSDVDGFKTFISSGDIAVEGTYRQTWEFIMRDLNSLQWHSNLHILFQYI